MNISNIKNFFENLTFKKAIWIAPLIFFFHVIEEIAFGFYIYMNKYRGGNRTLMSSIITNSAIMVVYFILIALFVFKPNRGSAFTILGGLLAAQFFNAFFHLFWTIYYGEYCPGLITGLVLYIPYEIFLVWKAYRETYISRTSGFILFILGAILMTLFEVEGLAWIILIGYLIFSIVFVMIYPKIYRKSIQKKKA